jgi:UDP-glucose:(heptosyl)LPS alpha-1,3-glucosyltransferase
MRSDHLKIAFVRRGYSSSGGAEAYLKRLAARVAAAGHEARLFTTDDWPPNEWQWGPITRLRNEAPTRFADELEQLRQRERVDVLMSLDRVWRCDVFRAGDGVHRAWLDRRAQFAGTVEKLRVAFNQKHRTAIKLEQALLRDRCAGVVIANSEMVKQEIIDYYGYPAERLHVVRNGVPVEQFCVTSEVRAAKRRELQLLERDVAVLFVGSGWERKGLQFAVEAVRRCPVAGMRLLVAGRGNQARYAASGVKFLGVRNDLPALYAAADVFLLPTIYDPFSNACLEALAAGLPVITTRANGFAEIMEQQLHGSTIESANDVQAISTALEFWSDEAQRAATRQLRIQRARDYDIARNVEQTLAILIQAASAASTSG